MIMLRKILIGKTRNFVKDIMLNRAGNTYNTPILYKTPNNNSNHLRIYGGSSNSLRAYKDFDPQKSWGGGLALNKYL